MQQIWLAATAIGKDTLSFSPKDIGLHSARSGAAMAMYLSGVPIYTIMLLGGSMVQWCILKIYMQIGQGKGIGNKMLTNDEFFTIPTTSSKDSSLHNHASEQSCRNNKGLCFNEVIKPLLEVFHYQYRWLLSIQQS